MKNLAYKELLDNLYDGVYAVDKNSLIVYWNKAAEQITGFPRAAVVGRACSDNILCHVDETGTELCRNACPLAKVIATGKTCEAEVFLHHRDGHRVPVSVRAVPMRDKNGNIVGSIELFSDNSSKIAIVDMLKDLERLTLLDPLTQLGNRRFAEMCMNSRLQEHKRYSYSFGVAMMDIDHFKRFNDTYGHDVGDKVLTMVASTMVNNSRSSDNFARWGGEEFIGIFRESNCETLFCAAERLRLLVRDSFLLSGNDRIQVTMSFGCALARAEDTMESILKRADEQLYRSKQEGRDRVSVGPP